MPNLTQKVGNVVRSLPGGTVVTCRCCHSILMWFGDCMSCGYQHDIGCALKEGHYYHGKITEYDR